MAEIWDLPPEGLVKPTGIEWLLHVQQMIPEAERAPALMTMWRIWHVFQDANVVKGKMVVNHVQGFTKAGTQMDGRRKVRKRWTHPASGEAKLNIDGPFLGKASTVGIVLRDHCGEPIFTVCQNLPHYNDATEAEIISIEEGLRLVWHRTPLKVKVEFDCTEAVEMIRESLPNTSAYAFRISAIRDLLRVEKEMFVLLKLAERLIL
ncbi:uncharacterized protein [Lolium perenne]|uniref:uncharacterized protein n=1 Tax=Lolium perenne TaxID=4522 RepID=UPI003A9A5F41